MRIDKSSLIGMSWLGGGLAMFPLAHVSSSESMAWLPYPIGVAGSVSCLMGLFHLAPELSARVIAQVAVVVAILQGKTPPDATKMVSEALKAFRRRDFDSCVTNNEDIAGYTAPPPSADEWNTYVRPVLHQSSQYTAPTYYLNANLQVIDWNLSFDLIFQPIIGDLRGRHVNWFIAHLENSDQVFAHARQFPVEVERQPQVDTEPLVYVTPSDQYGRIVFEKVATKLHDRHGQQQGWAVTLLIRSAARWDELIRDLKALIESDKFWSLYSVSYDLVLNRYSQYGELLHSVVRSVPDTAARVLDLGSGTGNMTRLLLEGDRSVWAVEKNIAMLDILRGKEFAQRAGDRLKIVKSSVEHLEMLKSEVPFDAATAVNLLYAVDDVAACLKSLGQVLKPGATFIFTTTDAETKLTPLLDDIRTSLADAPDFNSLAPHLNRVRELNLKLEATGLTTRYSRDQYFQWLKEAGFVVESYERAYVDAVLLVRARKAVN